LDIGAITIIDPEAVHVGAIYRKGGNRLDERSSQTIEREISRPTAPFRKRREPVCENVDLADHRGLHDESLVAPDESEKVDDFANGVRPGVLESCGICSFDKESVQQIEKLIARCTVNEPTVWNALLAAQDLLDDDKERPYSGVVGILIDT